MAGNFVANIEKWAITDKIRNKKNAAIGRILFNYEIAD